MTAGGDVRLAGAANFRDFGGCLTGDGDRVHTGVLYRSNRLSALTEADHNVLDDLGIRTIFDLRAKHERLADPTAWIRDGVEIRAFRAGPKRPLIEMARDHAPDAEGARALMLEFYGSMPLTMAPAFAAVLEALADDAAPCIIHCSAGKDRTGVASALILSALGVDRDVVFADYALTQTRIRTESEMARALSDPAAAAQWARYSPEAVAIMLASDPAYLEAAFAGIQTAFGSLDEYFSKALGLSINALERLRWRLTNRPEAILRAP